MQITTTVFAMHIITGCCLWCKDTNFNANHNQKEVYNFERIVVVYGAKILILMQITTGS